MLYFSLLPPGIVGGLLGEGASLAPLMVMVTTWDVPSTVFTVKLSVRVSPALSACTAGLLLSSV